MIKQSKAKKPLLFEFLQGRTVAIAKVLCRYLLNEGKVSEVFLGCCLSLGLSHPHRLFFHCVCVCVCLCMHVWWGGGPQRPSLSRRWGTGNTEVPVTKVRRLEATWVFIQPWLRGVSSARRTLGISGGDRLAAREHCIPAFPDEPSRV